MSTESHSSNKVAGTERARTIDTLDTPDLLSDAFLADPYPTYHRLLAEAPVHWNPIAGGAWIVTRYADIAALLRDSRLSVNRTDTYRQFMRDNDESRALMATISAELLFIDPPDHTRLRGLVSKAFTSPAVAALRPRVEQLTEQLLDLVRGDDFDLIHDFAYPLPARVITELLGLSAEAHDELRQWADDIMEFSGSIRGLKRALASNVAMRRYLEDVIEKRRRAPGDALLDRLIAAEEQGARLSNEELLATVILLFNAGHHTTMNLIGNGLLALLRHPDQLARLRAEPARLPSAVEELLRYDGPLQSTGRIALEDLTVSGTPIKRGELLLLMLGAANRDPDQFHSPDVLDVERSEPRHLAFGAGIHFCVGAALARLEAPIALAAILRRFQRLRVADEQLVWSRNFSLRGLKSLRVAADA